MKKIAEMAARILGCFILIFAYIRFMDQLAEIQKQAKELSEEDREGLVAFLLHGFSGAPSGPDDDEVSMRDAEMDSGSVTPISHNDFLAQVGRAGR
jgi:hypothetical protein